jgi:cytochrome c553
MRDPPARTVRPALKRALKRALLGGAGLALLGFLFVWSGVYSIAASRGHWAVMEWFLTFAMRNSVKTHAYGIAAPNLDDADMIRLGAGHFHSGCAFCHGAPGTPIGPIARGMLPPPPDLARQMRPWRDRELFWIVKNGIKYTGMPAWAAQQRDDEAWALVAFLRRLPALDAQGYRALALGSVEVQPQSGRKIATGETATSEAVGACARCHGDEHSAPASALVPILHGQPAEFLTAALQSYAAGRRASGIMQPVAAELGEEVAGVARTYARLSLPARPLDLRPDTIAAVARGRALAEGTDKIAPCAGCHRAEALKTFPRLAGQNAAYMANRLRLWKGGLAPGTDGEAIMAPIARGLSEQQIDDAAAYFASLAPTAPGR